MKPKAGVLAIDKKKEVGIKENKTGYRGRGEKESHPCVIQRDAIRKK